MGLERRLLAIRLEDRVSDDAGRNVLFLNFEGMHVRTDADIDLVRDSVEARCREIGRRVAVVVNYDGFRIDESLVDRYAEMVRYMEEQHCTRVSRYTTSAFMRLKLGDALERRAVAPHIFETAAEARALHDPGAGG